MLLSASFGSAAYRTGGGSSWFGGRASRRRVLQADQPSARLFNFRQIYCRVLALGALGGVSRGHPCRRGATGGRHSSPDRGSAVTNRDRKSTRLNSSH